MLLLDTILDEFYCIMPSFLHAIMPSNRGPEKQNEQQSSKFSKHTVSYSLRYNNQKHNNELYENQYPALIHLTLTFFFVINYTAIICFLAVSVNRNIGLLSLWFARVFCAFYMQIQIFPTRIQRELPITILIQSAIARSDGTADAQAKPRMFSHGPTSLGFVFVNQIWQCIHANSTSTRTNWVCFDRWKNIGYLNVSNPWLVQTPNSHWHQMCVHTTRPHPVWCFYCSSTNLRCLPSVPPRDSLLFLSVLVSWPLQHEPGAMRLAGKNDPETTVFLNKGDFPFHTGEWRCDIAIVEVAPPFGRWIELVYGDHNRNT